MVLKEAVKENFIEADSLLVRKVLHNCITVANHSSVDKAKPHYTLTG